MNIGLELNIRILFWASICAFSSVFAHLPKMWAIIMFSLLSRLIWSQCQEVLIAKMAWVLFHWEIQNNKILLKGFNLFVCMASLLHPVRWGVVLYSDGFKLRHATQTGLVIVLVLGKKSFHISLFIYFGKWFSVNNKPYYSPFNFEFLIKIRITNTETREGLRAYSRTYIKTQSQVLGFSVGGWVIYSNPSIYIYISIYISIDLSRW